jgi:serine/threonine-protein kinase SRPK3
MWCSSWRYVISSSSSQSLKRRSDLHPRNMLFKLGNLDHLSVDEIYERFGEPYKEIIKRVDGTLPGPQAPSYSVSVRPLVIYGDETSDPRIMIADFSESWLSDTATRETLNIPIAYMAPEATFSKAQIGKPVDVWSLACTVYEILGQRPLFQRSYFFDRDSVISEMVNTLGMLPKQWWEQWEARGDFFDDDGTWNPCEDRDCGVDTEPQPLLERIEKNGRKDDSEFGMEEMVELEKMLRTMLVYDPTERATMEQVAESDWMKRWGLPTLQKYSLVE